MKPHPDKEFLSTGEYTYKSKRRFRCPYDLWQRFDEVKSLTVTESFAKERRNIISMYDRTPYKVRKGGKVRREPNWGTFRDAVDDYIKFFSTLALDRNIWCRIETSEGVDEQMDTTWSDQITEAFHKFCIKKWKNRVPTILSVLRDDAMFNRGHLFWESPFDVYPCKVATEDVYADTNATTCPTSFDLLFVRKRFSAVELYKRATDPDYIQLGWRKAAILQALRHNFDDLRELDDKDIVAQFRRGGISQLDQDRKISLIYCLVREYDEAPEGHEREGNTISLMVIPESIVGLGVQTGPDGELTKQSTDQAQLLKRKDYLLYIDYYAKDFTQVIAQMTGDIEKGFYNTQSFAKQIFTGSEFHDKTTNSVIRAILRSMRLNVKTNSADTKKRLQTADADDEVFTFNQDDDVVQINFRQDVNAANELLRDMRFRINEFSPAEFSGSQTSPKGYPITKGEANIINQKLDDSKATAVKMYVANDEKFVGELYRRFVNCTEESDCYKNYRAFVKYLEKLGVPKKAWQMDNVCIYPRFNQFGGNASANFATSQALVQATQIKPATPAEYRAKFAHISSIVGEANVSEYMDEPMKFDSELFIIGQENEALDNMLNTPDNVPVTPSDNHMLHVERHLQDYMKKLELGAQLLRSGAQDQSYRRQFLLEEAAKLISSQDNKGAHIEAHFTLLASDETKNDAVKQLQNVFQQAQAQQDMLTQAVAKAVQDEIKANSRANMQDLEYQHAARMKELEYNARQAELNLDTEKKVRQIQTAEASNESKQRQKIAHKEQDQQVKAAGDQQKLQAEAEKKRLELEAKRAEMQAKKQAKAKPNEKETSTTESK